MIKPKWVKRLHGCLGIFKEGFNENRKVMVQGSKPLHANLPSPLPSTPSAHGQFPGSFLSLGSMFASLTKSSATMNMI